LKFAIFVLNLKSSKYPTMKKFISAITLAFAFFFAGAQTSIPVADPLQLKETEHNFGQIAQNKPVFYSFVISNTGTEPLKLDNVTATCGCTTPEWKREAIAPGASSVIKVGYNAAAEGPFEKPITITYNTNQTKQLKIYGTVWKAPEGAAPANASVQFLKKQTL
jgi:hypothetical protein